MARRRRKGNPLLLKILLISVAAHVIILPVLAHFGAFEKIKRSLGDSRVVMISLPPPDKEPPKPAPKAEKKTHTAAAKKPGGAPKASAAQKAGVPQPKVVASSGPADGSGGGATVDAGATGKAGILPPGAGGNGAPTPPPTSESSPKEPEPPKTEPPVTPPPKPPEPPVVEPKKLEVAPPPAPKPKRIVEAVATESPQPTIPDELRSEPFEKTLVVEADVDTGGHPTNVRVAETTGMKALDDAGLDAARRYRFRPATVDDEPVEQHVRFRIVFKVE